MEMQWWIWLVFGIALILLELVLPTFFILWFGIGAVLVSLISLLPPACNWTCRCCCGYCCHHHRVVQAVPPQAAGCALDRRQRDRRSRPADRQRVEFQKGRVRFQKPILGNEEWTCVADSDIPAGERVRLTAIEGTPPASPGPESALKGVRNMTSLIVVAPSPCSS
jgi:membrane protein implicated in regulation of membrane protease activity